MKTPLPAFAAALMGTLMLATPALAMVPSMHAIRQGDRATMALNALEAKGYVNFSNFRPDGRNFAAEVTKDGKTINVVVAPETGTVTVQS